MSKKKIAFITGPSYAQVIKNHRENQELEWKINEMKRLNNENTHN
jgi:hypothetical protein